MGDYTREAFCVCGYEDLAKQYEVNLLDTQQDTFYEQDCGGLSLHICDCVRQFDFLINVPVLKGHCQTGITCALKNMKGLIPNAEKRRFHRLGLSPSPLPIWGWASVRILSWWTTSAGIPTLRTGAVPSI